MHDHASELCQQWNHWVTVLDKLLLKLFFHVVPPACLVHILDFLVHCCFGCGAFRFPALAAWCNALVSQPLGRCVEIASGLQRQFRKSYTIKLVLFVFL